MTEPRRLTRGRPAMLGGVCAGIADYSGADVSMIRLVAVVAAVLGFGSLVLVYLAAWLILPPAPALDTD